LVRSPLDHIGRRPKRSPFGTDLRIYQAPKPARRLRGKLILAAFMGAATLATGLFIQVRLAQKPDTLISLDTGPEPAAATPATTGVAETATLVVPVPATKVRTVSIPAGSATTEEVDHDALSHDDPRWGPAQVAAAAKAKAARAVASAAADPALAFAAPDTSKPEGDGDQTAAIGPTVILPKPVVEDETADVEPDDGAARTARIARAVNMRSSPRSGSKVIRVIPAGVNVGLYSCKGWCEVTYQGSRGFIYKSFLQGGGSAASKPRAAAPKAAEKKPDTLLKILTQR